jgi:RND family efflux transporter MFP subunit
MIMHRELISSILATALLAVWVAGCTPKNEFVEPPPPKVTVSEPLQQTVTVFIPIPGRVQAKESAEIRARVQGYLRSVEFEDGDRVEEGQDLFVIEPEPFEAALEAAVANLAQAAANKSIAKTERDRREQAFQSKAISEIDLERARADLKAAEAVELGAKATVAQAELDLSYTTNKAPISGWIARKFVDPGNLVGGAEPTLLTTIIADDPIYVYCNISERLVIETLNRRGRVRSDTKMGPFVTLELADGSRHPTTGYFDYMDNVVDPETGTITVRAVFDNKEAMLVPGLYGKILIPSVRTNAMLVPDLSIQRDIGGAYVLVVDDGGTVSSAYVELGAKVEEGRIIEDGLEASDRVIVNGIQRARPGIKVDATKGESPASVPSEVIVER